MNNTISITDHLGIFGFDNIKTGSVGMIKGNYVSKTDIHPIDLDISLMKKDIEKDKTAYNKNSNTFPHLCDKYTKLID